METGKQIGTWLGFGDIALNSLFVKVRFDGQTSTQFHAAADGQGATITVMMARRGTGPYELFGGYNPLSWNDDQLNEQTPIPANRTAFLFNLTTLEKQNQITTSTPWDGETGTPAGQFTVYNRSNLGPAFGFGYDLAAFQDLNNGMSYQWSYGPVGASRGLDPIYGSGPANALEIAGFEVYTITDLEDTAPVPEPTSLLLLGTGLVTLARHYRRRKT